MYVAYPVDFIVLGLATLDFCDEHSKSLLFHVTC
jgi:hypothetical protein